MNKKKLNIVVVLLVIAGGSTAQSLTVESVEAKTGEQAALTVSLSEATTMTALQFNLALPEGVTLADSEVTMGTATDNHTLSMQTLDSGDRLIAVYSTDLNTFKEGELMRIPVTIGNDAKTGYGKLYTVRMATTDAVSNTFAELPFTVTVKSPGQPATSINETLISDKGTNNVEYDLQGRRVTHPSKGIYVIGGQKMVKGQKK